MIGVKFPGLSGGFPLRDILILIRKDLKVEARARYAMTVAFAFALCAVFMEAVSLGGVQSTARVHSAIIWVTVFFSTTQVVSHIFTREGDEGTELILRVRFHSRDIYIAKFICSLILVTPVALCAVSLYLFFFSIMPASPVLLILLVIAGSCAVAGGSALPSMLASRARGRGSLAALLSVPSVLPALIVLVRGTAISMTEADASLNDVFFLTAYGLFMAGVSVFLFDFSWKE